MAHRYNKGSSRFIEFKNGPRTLFLRRYASLVILILLSLGSRASAWPPVPASAVSQDTQTQSSLSSMSTYVGRVVQSVNLPGVPDSDHLLQMLPQKPGQPLDRDQVRESIRALFETGRFADIQAEVSPVDSDVVLTFMTSLNFFIGAVDVEGAPGHPSYNQIVNASKFQLGELHTLDKLDRALQNIRQLMQENGYYRARVTAESASNPATQQVNILFHISAGEPAHVGEVKVTGHSAWSQGQVQDIARMHPADRVTAARTTNSLQRLRKKFQKQQRVLAQVSTLGHEVSRRIKFGGLHISDRTGAGSYCLCPRLPPIEAAAHFQKQIPIYEENALDEDLLNEGKHNLLNYLQARGLFDASVDFVRENAPNMVRVIYRVNAGPVHKLELISIAGNKYFPRQTIRQRLQIQPAGIFFKGRYSDALLKSDVASLQALYVSNGFRQAKIETKVDDDYHGADTHLAVHIQIEEGPQTLVGAFRILGNQKIETKSFPELVSASGQPYSEQNLASDRETILNYYFNHGFPNAVLEIDTATSNQPNREDVTYKHSGRPAIFRKPLDDCGPGAHSGLCGATGSASGSRAGFEPAGYFGHPNQTVRSRHL